MLDLEHDFIDTFLSLIFLKRWKVLHLISPSHSRVQRTGCSSPKWWREHFESELYRGKCY